MCLLVATARAYLDLDIEVGREGDLGFEHGPILAHEVAVHCRHRVPRLLLFQSCLPHHRHTQSCVFPPWYISVRSTAWRAQQFLCQLRRAALVGEAQGAKNEYKYPPVRSAEYSIQLCQGYGCICRLEGPLTEFRFMSQPRRIPSLRRGNPSISSSSWLSSFCTKWQHFSRLPL